jgi:hypothetical protein
VQGSRKQCCGREPSWGNDSVLNVWTLNWGTDTVQLNQFPSSPPACNIVLHFGTNSEGPASCVTPRFRGRPSSNRARSPSSGVPCGSSGTHHSRPILILATINHFSIRPPAAVGVASASAAAAARARHPAAAAPPECQLGVPVGRVSGIRSPAAVQA